MRLSDFDYDLPRELIAQAPPVERTLARLLVPRGDGVQHATIAELPGFLRSGDLLVVNDTRVRRARVQARRATGGRVELFLLGREPTPARPWKALVKPARKLEPGERLALELPDGTPVAGWQVVALERLPQDPGDPDSPPGPCWLLDLLPSAESTPSAEADVEALVERIGRVPLPPYIQRAVEAPDDAERYQTVFAREPGAVAAPTAGLHLTADLLGELAAAGIDHVAVTLHVGLGTFANVEVENIAEHTMHAETFELTPEVAARINATRAAGGRIVAIGTTSVRVLETLADSDGRVQPGRGATDIFITPGYAFRVVDVLLTNFHLPKSTLLMLVSAFVGHARAMELYRVAVAERYRFFSFGDAMLLTR